MSPLAIEMLLHVHCTPVPYDDRGGQAQKNIYHFFLSEELIAETKDGGATLFGRLYRTTSRGAAMVKKLETVPLPVQYWL